MLEWVLSMPMKMISSRKIQVSPFFRANFSKLTTHTKKLFVAGSFDLSLLEKKVKVISRKLSGISITGPKKGNS